MNTFKICKLKNLFYENYLQIITMLLFYSFYTEMIFLFRKSERKDVELMNLSLWT